MKTIYLTFLNIISFEVSNKSNFTDCQCLRSQKLCLYSHNISSMNFLCMDKNCLYRETIIRSILCKHNTVCCSCCFYSRTSVPKVLDIMILTKNVQRYWKQHNKYATSCSIQLLIKIFARPLFDQNKHLIINKYVILIQLFSI